jgi:hypothetical protein
MFASAILSEHSDRLAHIINTKANVMDALAVLAQELVDLRSFRGRLDELYERVTAVKVGETNAMRVARFSRGDLEAETIAEELERLICASHDDGYVIKAPDHRLDVACSGIPHAIIHRRPLTHAPPAQAKSNGQAPACGR